MHYLLPYYRDLEAALICEPEDFPDNLSNESLGNALKANALLVGENSKIWDVYGAISFAYLANIYESDAIICSIDLPLKYGRQWTLELLPLDVENEDSEKPLKKKLYSALDMEKRHPEEAEMNLQPVPESWFEIMVNSTLDPLLARFYAFRYRRRLPILSVPSNLLGAAAKTLLKPYKLKGNRSSGFSAACDLLNVIVNMDRSNATFGSLSLHQAQYRGVDVRDSKLKISNENHVEEKIDLEACVTKTWYPNGVMDFGEFSNQFKKIYNLTTHRENNRVKFVTVYGTEADASEKDAQ